jgi:hypothetical protein
VWRNEYEIADILDGAAHAPDKRVVAHALVLARWVNIVNQNSDGWPYWRAGAKAGEKLSDLLARAVGHHSRPDRDSLPRGASWWDPYVPTDAEWRATLTPMKTLATKRGLPSPLAVLEGLTR